MSRKRADFEKEDEFVWPPEPLEPYHGKPVPITKMGFTMPSELAQGVRTVQEILDAAEAEPDDAKWRRTENDEE